MVFIPAVVPRDGDAGVTKSWVSGTKNADLAEKLRREIAELESRRDALVEKNKRALFDWGSFVLNGRNAPQDLASIRDHPASRDVNEAVSDYEALSQAIMDKQVLLNEKLDEQAKADSLG